MFWLSDAFTICNECNIKLNGIYCLVVTGPISHGMLAIFLFCFVKTGYFELNHCYNLLSSCYYHFFFFEKLMHLEKPILADWVDNQMQWKHRSAWQGTEQNSGSTKTVAQYNCILNRCTEVPIPENLTNTKIYHIEILGLLSSLQMTISRQINFIPDSPFQFSRLNTSITVVIPVGATFCTYIGDNFSNNWKEMKYTYCKASAGKTSQHL